MTREEVVAKIEEIGIFPGIRVHSGDHALFCTENLWGAGIPVAEITMTVPGGIEVIRTVADTRETYIERRGAKAVSHLPIESPHWAWNVLIFPIKLHDDRDGAVLTARLIERK